MVVNDNAYLRVKRNALGSIVGTPPGASCAVILTADIHVLAVHCHGGCVRDAFGRAGSPAALITPRNE
ncbi:hypothetical protein EMIT0P291_130060 [Pseudomonas sp. IT-P291]